jgi:hypothetical protein
MLNFPFKNEHNICFFIIESKTVTWTCLIPECSEQEVGQLTLILVSTLKPALRMARRLDTSATQQLKRIKVLLLTLTFDP